MKARKNSLEWAVFGISAAIIAVLAGFIALDATRDGSPTPEIHIETGAPIARGDRFAVPVLVTNRGRETAEGLRVEIALRDGQRDVEVAEVTFAFVPRASHREAWALFRKDPRGMEIETRALGFEKP